MIFAKDTTYGLESTIKLLQSHIDSSLTALPWLGVNAIYGLIHRNQTKNGIEPESYLGTGIGNKEYGNPFLNDKITCTIGFIEVGERELNPRNVNVDVICTMRLDSAYGSNLRNDEFALLQFEDVLKNFISINKVDSIRLGINSVFNGFFTDNIKYRDLHPWFVFSMRVRLYYENDINCSSINVN